MNRVIAYLLAGLIVVQALNAQELAQCDQPLPVSNFVIAVLIWPITLFVAGQPGEQLACSFGGPK